VQAKGVVAALVAWGMVWTGAAAAAERIEVPIRQTRVLPRLIHYSIPVSIAGGAPIEAMLDSGSTGLRLLPPAMPAQGLEETDTRTIYSYGIGLKITGKVWEGEVSVGGAETAGAIRIHAISAIGCVPSKPKCPGAKTTIDRFLLGGRGDPEHGYQAIIGVGLAPNAVVNPLAAIGDGVWIITLPKPDTGKPGKLILNPTAEERAGFTMFQLERKDLNTPFGQMRGWDAHIPGCLANANTKRSFCAPSLLDSGAPGMLAHSNKKSETDGWNSGAPALFAFVTNGKVIGSDGFLINMQPGSGFNVSERDEGPLERELKMGTLPYFSFDVLYDSKAGMIGLKKRTD
jgi:hypothetical protein